MSARHAHLARARALQRWRRDRPWSHVPTRSMVFNAEITALRTSTDGETLLIFTENAVYSFNGKEIVRKLDAGCRS